ncbi:MAG TPA: hypothetical protein ENN34_12785 [Deltaproteobacteria bacterium]|mgnify:CR=1 FL=1|nr:septum formation initiator family protein [Desulfomonilia bacterium]HDP26300.1 hypothetical protein [Deltaproteobacteria bacterium]
MTFSRAITCGLLLFLALTLVFTIPGEKGLIRSFRLYKELQDLRSQEFSLNQENTVLMQEATLLKENLAYIEHVINQELNLVRPEDIIVVFKKKKIESRGD